MGWEMGAGRLPMSWAHTYAHIDCTNGLRRLLITTTTKVDLELGRRWGGNTRKC